MQNPLLTALLAIGFAWAMAGCATAPVSSLPFASLSSTRGVNAALAPNHEGEPTAPTTLHQRPPDKLFGILQELGSPDAEPDVAAMVAYQQDRKQQRTNLRTKGLVVSPWEDLGPYNNLGRVVDVAFHPQDSNIIYVASPGGGVYRTTDGGATWFWLAGLPYQAVNSIAIDPLNPNVIYVGTGHFNNSGSDLLSMGVYKSSDGGLTFSLLMATVPTIANTDWLRITRVIAHPTVANLVFAGTAAGFFLSNDGGAIWSKVSAAATYDIAIDPNNPAKMVRGRYDGSVSYSTNSGASWSMAAIVPSSATARIQTRVKYAMSAPNVVYASVNRNAGELHKSIDGGLNWSLVSTPGHDETQGFHTNQLWVSPVDANHIIVGGVDIYKSLDGGVNFTKISNWQTNSSQTGTGVTPTTPHADQNALASPANYSAANPLLFAGTDGGLFTAANARTVTEFSGWNKSNGNLYISQFVGAAGRRLNSIDALVGGLQDNGTIRFLGASTWSRFGSGDGGHIAIDPVEDAVFGTYQQGRVHRCLACVGVTTICAGITEADPANCGTANVLAVNFYAPLELDPNNSSRLYLGANSLWLSSNTKAAVPTWSVAKAPVAGTTTGTASTNYINAVSIHQANSNIVLVGHNDGQIFRTSNMLSAIPTWSALAGSLPTGRMVGALLIDPVDSNRIYVGFSGYFADNFWRSDNGGATWQNISSGLPPGSIYSITRHPLAKDKLFVGTIWGSYGSDNGGVTWPPVNDGPYDTQIRRLFWLGNDTLVAASFGSGMGKATVTADTDKALAIEYFNQGFGHYFITSKTDEIAKLDNGTFVGWARTGQSFNVYALVGTSRVPVCRFFTTAFPPSSSHFYAPRGLGCEGTLLNANWQYEGEGAQVFYSLLPDAAGACPAGNVPIYRLYNNGKGGAPNHRFTTSLVIRTQMVNLGYVPEGTGIGVGMCSPT